jgi:hypothetical protein
MSSISLEEYRKKHKRCRYCKYIGHIGGGDRHITNWCHAKAKHKYEWILLVFMNNIQGCFCSVYEQKEP